MYFCVMRTSKHPPPELRYAHERPQIKNIPGDTQMRTILDEIPADSLRYSVAMTHFESTKVLDSSRYHAADK